ncbi:MAG: hypothetical protein ABJB12_10160 [Pseudomonadota bacterium]
MFRVLAGTIAGVVLLGCGPDRPKCMGSNADFVVTLKLSDRALPSDTVVHVLYGGTGTEDYVLAQPTTPEVVFCYPADENGTRIETPADSEVETAGAAGAAGASGVEAPVYQLVCSLWTGGYSKLQVSGTGLDEGTSYDLAPTDNTCVVKRTIVLDSPDGG